MAAATSGRRLGGVGTLIAVVVWSVACSTPAPPHDGPAAAAVPPPARPVCFGPVPADWAAGLRATTVQIPSGNTFGIGAVDRDTAVGQFTSPTGAGVGTVDLATGRLSPISPFEPNAGGLGAIAFERPWIVWEQLDSRTNLADWSVHAFNVATGDQFVLATSRTPDGFLEGQQPIPVLRDGIAAWAQPVRAGDGSTAAEIRLMRLKTREVTILDSGMVSSPVFAGGYLIWARFSAGEYEFRAAYADSHRPAALPDDLRNPDSVGYLAGSPGYLAWGSRDGTVLTVWRADTHTFARYSIRDSRHHFQFLTLAGTYVVWFSGTVSAVLDLTTAMGFDVAGTVAGSPTSMVFASGIAPAAGQEGGAAISSIRTSNAPAIRSCRATAGPQ